MHKFALLTFVSALVASHSASAAECNAYVDNVSTEVFEDYVMSVWNVQHNAGLAAHAAIQFNYTILYATANGDRIFENGTFHENVPGSGKQFTTKNSVNSKPHAIISVKFDDIKCLYEQ
jgi:hypothetical protein